MMRPTLPPSLLRLTKSGQPGLDPEHEIGRPFFEESDKHLRINDLREFPRQQPVRVWFSTSDFQTSVSTSPRS